jgi:hypothetical protein
MDKYPITSNKFDENDTQKTRDTRTFTSPHASCTWSQVTTPSNNGTLKCHISIPVLYVSEIIFEKATIAETVLRVWNTVSSCNQYMFIFMEVNWCSLHSGETAYQMMANIIFSA